MSNELAAVRFKNGEIFFTAYHGTGSSVCPVLRMTVEEVKKDPFPDPEWNEWLANAPEDSSSDDFYKELEQIVHPNIEDVEIYTPYAGGISWKAKASKTSLRVTENLSDDCDLETGLPSLYFKERIK